MIEGNSSQLTFVGTNNSSPSNLTDLLSTAYIMSLAVSIECQ